MKKRTSADPNLQTLSGLRSLGQMPVRLALGYLVVLYALAVVWGAASGVLIEYAPRALAYRLRLTPVSPSPNVFNDTIEKLVHTEENRRLRNTPGQQVPWLRVQRDAIAIVGRLRRGSVDFEVDKPVEVFLSPAYRSGAGGALPWLPLPGANAQGVYLRLLSTDVAEVFTARSDWTPPQAELQPPASSAEQPAEAEDEGGGSRDW